MQRTNEEFIRFDIRRSRRNIKELEQSLRYERRKLNLYWQELANLRSKPEPKEQHVKAQTE